MKTNTKEQLLDYILEYKADMWGFNSEDYITEYIAIKNDTPVTKFT